MWFCHISPHGAAASCHTALTHPPTDRRTAVSTAGCGHKGKAVLRNRSHRTATPRGASLLILGAFPLPSRTMFNGDLFIQSIHERPALWKKNAKEYLDKNCKEKAWLEVGSIMYNDWLHLESTERREKGMIHHRLVVVSKSNSSTNIYICL